MPDIPPSPRVDRSFSLSTLFLLTAACASVLGLITPLVRSRVGEDIGLSEFAASVVFGGVALGAVGMVLGLLHYQRLINAITGLLLGIVLGVVVGPLVFVPSESLSYVLASAAGSAVTLLGLAAAIRLSSGGWRKVDRISAVPRPRYPRAHPLDSEPEEGS